MKEKMKAEVFTAEHHPTLASWWEAHGWPVIPMSSLPARGLLVGEENPVVAGFLYITDSDIGIMEWIVSDPKSSIFERSKSLDYLIEELCTLGKTLGCRLLLTFLKHDGLMKRVEKLGFVQTDKAMTHFGREL